MPDSSLVGEGRGRGGGRRFKRFLFMHGRQTRFLNRGFGGGGGRGKGGGGMEV